MTSKQFFKYLLEPAQMDDKTVVEMEQLIKQFPFFQTGHLLYLKALSKISDKLVKEKLPTESLYISNRAKLYALLNSKQESPAQETKQVSAQTKAEEPKAKEESKPAPETAEVKEKKEEKVEKKAETKQQEAPKTEPTQETKTETKKVAVADIPAPANDKKQEQEDKKQEPLAPTKKTDEKAAPKKEAKAESPDAKTQLTNEERKMNHERLVRDFFELNDIEKYETVATNVAADGTIKSAAAEFAAKSKADADSAPAATSTTTVTTTTTTVTTTESKAPEVKAPEEKAVEAKAPKAEPEKTIVVEDTKQEDTKTEEKESKDAIFEKIAALRKEQEEADKKRIVAEQEAKELSDKLKAEEAERKAKETVVTETVTTTVVTETVTTTVTTEPAKQEQPQEVQQAANENKEAEKPAPEEKEMSAADKLMARLNKMKNSEQTPKSNPDSLIEKFLQAEPHLDRNKVVSEADMGQDSIKQPKLYSEKLAALYIQQGHLDQAIESYQILILKYPEKSAYFASKIEEINKLKNNNQ